MDLTEKLEQMRRNSITLEIAGNEAYKLCGTRFGGQPDVPPGFVWPTFDGEDYDGERKVRPLAFLAQFNCAELAAYDTEHLLPDHGLLSFFYDTETQRWGFEPKDKGCARVFWFEDISILSVSEFPAAMEEDAKFPRIGIKAAQEPSFPAWADFVYPDTSSDADYEAFETAQMVLGAQEPEERSKLLGWPDVIQGSMAVECDLVIQGYDLGGEWGCIPKDVRQQAEQSALDRWQLLFQLDTVEGDDFCLMFGDCGRIYFYILKEDLRNRRFDRVWLILQCY